MLDIAIAQLNVTVGDFDGNAAAIIDRMGRASEGGAQMVVFSELSLCAYYPGDLFEDAAFLYGLEQALDTVLQASIRWPALVTVLGTARRNHGPGKPLHNALLAIQDGRIVAEYYKQLLPTYGIFDEGRHFEPGPATACTLDVAGAKVGFMICEDGWNDSGRDYTVNPFEALHAARPDLIVSINASPSDIGKRALRHAVFGAACAHQNLPLLFVNQVGGQDQLVFDGASFAISPQQGLQFEAARFVEDFQLLRFDAGCFTHTDGQPFAVPDPAGIPAVEFSRRQIVVGITMPSVFSSAGSVTDSVALCANLGIALYTHPIRDIVAQYEAGYAAAFDGKLQGLPLENLQARVRGTILMEYSNAFGALLLTTGNKSEISVGYCTLYGDTNGGLGLIGDLYKTEVFSLSRHLNDSAGRELIPVAVLDKPPSAELAPGQRDTDSLPPYPVLDEILKWHIEGARLPAAESGQALCFVDQLRETDEGRRLVTRILCLVARNEYKRRQAAPIIRVRSRAFGSGRQMPIAAHYPSGEQA